jgi:hypothetical protein
MEVLFKKNVYPLILIDIWSWEDLIRRLGCSLEIAKLRRQLFSYAGKKRNLLL